MFKLVKILSLVLLSVFFASAGTTGKISGVITDSETGDPLPGVNVIVEGTLLGASTDLDGSYVILHVPAGTYNVVFSYIGYGEVKVENVRIVPDITKRLDMQMTPSTLELDEQIVIVAEKPFFEVSATNTVKVIDSEEIERIPVKGVNQVVSLNAGVVMADGSGGETGNATINVRGGRGNETLVVVDGIPYNDLLGGGAQGTIPDNAIEQISTQLGGFSAKYGSAQSGIVNIVTKSGAREYTGGFEGVSSELTDDFGYNSVSGYVSGPIVPDSKNLSFFLSGEYISTGDENPRAIGLKIPTVGIDSRSLPNTGGEVIRFSSKFDANYDDFKVTLSANGSLREWNGYVHSYAKNNSEHNTLNTEDVLGGSLRFTHFLDENTFWDVTARVRNTDTESGDGVWFDNLEAYGDTTANLNYYRGRVDPSDPMFTRDGYWRQGNRVLQDEIGVFYDQGRVNNGYTKSNVMTYGLDLNFSKQWDNHFIEMGATAEQSSVRYYNIAPVGLQIPSLTDPYYDVRPFMFGYDNRGNEIDSDQGLTAYDGNFWRNDGPKSPITAAFYIQDKYEFEDFILNFGIRWDYFDPNTKRIRDVNDMFRFGPNPNRLDPEDWEDAPAETYFSPRFGFAFPVSEKTVFHAQYGVFRQSPRLFDIYTDWFALETLETDDNRTAYHSNLQSETTTQYEFGLKHQIGDFASLDVTAFYKNVKGLTNIVRELTKLGQDTIPYLTTANTDFGTVKGLAFSFNLRRLGPLSARLDYTLSDAQGTGSSQTSSFTAAFRNTDGETPKSIAPLSFDQRHTLTASIDIRAFENEGPQLGNFYLFENTGLNMLVTYNSGRPYTPLEFVNVLPGAGSNLGDLTQYINSARGDGVFRVDLKLERNVNITQGISLQPYLVVQNLFDRENSNAVYASTGKAGDSGFLDTPVGEAFTNSSSDPEAFASDYEAFERNPGQYGLPRIIRLGMKVRF